MLGHFRVIHGQNSVTKIPISLLFLWFEFGSSSFPESGIKIFKFFFGQKRLKKAKLGKTRIRNQIKIRYFLSVLKFLDRNSDIESTVIILVISSFHNLSPWFDLLLHTLNRPRVSAVSKMSPVTIFLCHPIFAVNKNTNFSLTNW